MDGLLFDELVGFGMRLSGGFWFNGYFGREERVRWFYFHCVTIMGYNLFGKFDFIYPNKSVWRKKDRH